MIQVHLRGTFAPTRHAAAYWRDRNRATGEDGRRTDHQHLVGLRHLRQVGQTNYGAAKMGIAAFTMIASRELARYGVTVNAIAPGARTRMTEGLMGDGTGPAQPGGFDPAAPENVSPLVAWLVSEESSGVTGRVFNILGGSLSVAEGWHAGPGVEIGARFDPESLGEVVTRLVAEAAPNADITGRVD